MVFQPKQEHHTFLEVFRELEEEFGYWRADTLYRWAQYYTYVNNRDFYNVLNEHPDIIAMCAKKTGEDFKHPYMIGNFWGVPWPEPNRKDTTEMTFT